MYYLDILCLLYTVLVLYIIPTKVPKQLFWRGALAISGLKRPKLTKRTLKNTQRIPLRYMHRRGGIFRTTVACTRARPPELCPAMALHNKNGRIPHYKAGKPLSGRHLTKYKAYWTRLVSTVIGEQLSAITN